MEKNTAIFFANKKKLHLEEYISFAFSILPFLDFKFEKKNNF